MTSDLHLRERRRREDRIVIVGASLAGLRTAETLRERGFTGRLTVVGAEEHLPYARPPLSKAALTEAADPASMALQISARLNAKWLLGNAATALDIENQAVTLADGRSLPYDGLVITTGVRPRTLDAVDHGHDGVHYLRTIEDTTRLRDALTGRPRRVVVVGAGLIGTEVAAGARILGHEVTLVAAGPSPLHSATGPLVGDYCKDLHTSHGVQVLANVRARGIDAAGPASMTVRLTNGRILEGDLVVAALGAVPNTDWLTGSGLELSGGLHTNRYLQAVTRTGRALRNVVAAGDVVAWPPSGPIGRRVRMEHWSNAVEQARVAAGNVLAALAGSRGDGATPLLMRHETVPSFWTHQYDTRIHAIGLPHLAQVTEVVDGDVSKGRFVAGYFVSDELVGAVSVNMASRVPHWRQQLAAQAPGPQETPVPDPVPLCSPTVLNDPSGKERTGP